MVSGCCCLFVDVDGGMFAAEVGMMEGAVGRLTDGGMIGWKRTRGVAILCELGGMLLLLLFGDCEVDGWFRAWAR